ncbi:response regulator [Paenibacillus sp. SI8]|uniref:response regulator transcription factor n=1 Tax=unclassified Paenibacillus TaxID=185978 RepID=UPI0034674B36
MYKVLIIDDEEPVREAIKILGNWSILGITEIFEAENGLEGLEAVREHRPHIVLVDMRMPELEGPEFLQKAENEQLDLVAIVISGYNDFNYMRQAIKSNTVDYLLKPVKKSEINQALSAAITQLEEKRKQKEESIERNMAINMSLPMLKQHTYYSIIEKNFNPQTIKTNLTYIQPDYANSSLQIQMVLLRLLNLETIAASRFNKEMDSLHDAVTNVINEPNIDDMSCFSFANPKLPSEVLIVLSHQGKSSTEYRNKVISMMKRLVRKLEEFIGVVAVCAIGPVYPDVFSLSDAYKASEQIMNTINMIDRKEFVFTEPASPEKIKVHSIAAKAPLLRQAFEHDGSGIRHSIMKDYMNTIGLSGYLGLGNAYRNQEELSMLLYDIALDAGVSPDALVQATEPYKGTMSAGLDFKNVSEFEKSLFHLMDHYGEMIRTALQSSKAFNVNEIKTYIDRHYFEEITVAMFTEKYYLSREYLMKLFKQEFGYGIYEYVLKVRMEKAKELLNDPTLKIQVISELLGYSNNNYFSKAFKKYFEISPTEYRIHQWGDAN